MDRAKELIAAIQNVSKKIREVKEKELESIQLQDFSMSSFMYIEEIHRMGNPTFIELARQLAYSKPTVTLMVAKLIEKGYVLKTQSSDDARTYYLGLTQKGEKIIKGYHKVYTEYVNKISSQFSNEEMETLIALLKRM